ncbi:MAG: hypothetical protein OXI60_00025 [Acidiferrobacterales bacterium]|nr:hypothetical protein [Acidiferrobacterales bacterium]
MAGLPKNLIYAIAPRLVLNFAAMAFVGVTAFFCWQTDAWQNLFNLRGFVFLVCGLIVAGGIIGAVPARLHRALARVIVSRSDGELGTTGAAIIRWTGTIVLLGQLLLVYYLTAWAFELWIATPPA